MKFSLKSILCNISYAVNLPEYLGPFRKNKIIVLMYHGIVKSYSQNPLKNIYGYNISEKQFEAQMSYLSRHCNVITASEAIAGEKISHNKKNVVITFDDGYRNNYTNVFPILLRYNLPALFSIPTVFVLNRIPLWHDVVEYVVAITNKKLVHIKWNNTSLEFKLDTTTEKIELIKWLLSKCIEIIQEEREQFISYVLRELDVFPDKDQILEDPDYEPLTPQEIKIMAESKMAEFASHSVHHYILSRVNRETLINELTNSKLAIEQLTGLTCKYLCAPGGYYDNSVINAALDAGFEKFFSSENTEFDPTNIPYIIGRYCIKKFTSKSLFADIVHGSFHRMSHFLKSRK